MATCSTGLGGSGQSRSLLPNEISWAAGAIRGLARRRIHRVKTKPHRPCSPRPGRRRFPTARNGAAVAAAAVGCPADLLLRRFSATAARSNTRPPVAFKPLAPLSGADLNIPHGLPMEMPGA